MSIGGGSNKSSGGGTQMSEQKDFGSQVWAEQSPYLQDLFRRGQGTLGASAWPTGIETELLKQAGNVNAAQAEQGLQQSNRALTQYLTPGIDPSVNAYATNLGQQFREQFLPELQGQAALAGGLGGSRQQIGSALGAQRAMQTLGDFTAQTYSGQADRALSAAQSIAANSAGFQNNANFRLQQADFARSMPWYALQQYQGLLGSPTQIDLGGYSKSSGSQTTKSGGWNANFGFGSG